MIQLAKHLERRRRKSKQVAGADRPGAKDIGMRHVLGKEGKKSKNSDLSKDPARQPLAAYGLLIIPIYEYFIYCLFFQVLTNRLRDVNLPVAAGADLAECFCFTFCSSLDSDYAYC